VYQLGVAGYLAYIGETAYALALLGLILPQIFFQFKYFLKDPIEYDVKYQVGRMGGKEEEIFCGTKCFLLSCSVVAGKSSSGMLSPGVLRIIIIAYVPLHVHDSLLYQHARFRPGRRVRSLSLCWAS